MNKYTWYVENPQYDGRYLITTSKDNKVDIDAFIGGRWINHANHEIWAWTYLPYPYVPDCIAWRVTDI